MTQKLLKLAVVSIVLTGLAVYLWFFGKPGGHNKNPLENVDIETVSKIGIKNSYGTIELEKGAEGWIVSSPVRDVADPVVTASILDALEGFSVGSVISENAAKYPQFEIDDARAIRFQVWAAGNPEAVVDGYVGKVTADYQTSYFRFAASTPVYVVSGIQRYQLEQDPQNFRLSRVLPLPVEQADAVSVSQDKSTLDLVRSSDTWSRRDGNHPIDGKAVRHFLTELSGLLIDDFGTGEEKPERLGFERPYLKVRIEVNGKLFSMIAGAKAPLFSPQATPTRYVKVEGREALLIVRDEALANILAVLTPLR